MSSITQLHILGFGQSQLSVALTQTGMKSHAKAALGSRVSTRSRTVSRRPISGKATITSQFQHRVSYVYASRLGFSKRREMSCILDMDYVHTVWYVKRMQWLTEISVRNIMVASMPICNVITANMSRSHKKMATSLSIGKGYISITYRVGIIF